MPSVISLQELEQLAPIFRGKGGHALARALMKMLAVDKVCDTTDRNSFSQGPDFAHNILRDFGGIYQIGNSHRLQALPQGPFITVSNHAYGHMDGILLADIFGHLRSDYKIMVNKILTRIYPLTPSFITVIPQGNVKKSPTSESLAGIKSVLSHVGAGHPVGFFPSGAVSDLSLKDRCIRDRDWQDDVIKLIRKVRVPVVPVRFFDRNSMFYYLLGLIDWRIRVARLPAELFNKQGKRLRLAVGETISVEEQQQCTSIGELKTLLRRSVYDMPLPDDFVNKDDFFSSFVPTV